MVVGAGLAGCSGTPADHGADVPGRAREALDCAGKPWQQGAGNYDSGPEAVQGDARKAVDDWLEEEGVLLPDIEVDEAGRHGRAVLFTWSEAGDRLGAFVVHEGMDGADGKRGWGVYSYAYCDPSDWPPRVSDGAGFQVWVDSEGDRVPTSLVYSSPGPEHCDWQESTFLFLGHEGQDGIFVGHPVPDLAGYLRTTYAEHVERAADARDTGYARDGRELWVTADAAYLTLPDGDSERWPAESQPIGCA
jgi:hypothetical protein